MRNMILKIVDKYHTQISKCIPKYIDAGYVFSNSVVCDNSLRHINLPTRLSNEYDIETRLKKRESLLNSKEVVFTIPGSVLNNIRDYKSVIDSFKMILLKGINNFHVNLLGKISDDEISKMIKDEKMSSYFTTFKDFVPQEVFANTMINSHYVISPIKAGLPYGKYKTTGNIGDAGAYCVPLILPESYAPYYDFGKSVIRYKSDELATVLEKCIQAVENGSYLDLFESSMKRCKSLTTDEVAKNFETLLNEIIPDGFKKNNVLLP